MKRLRHPAKAARLVHGAHRGACTEAAGLRLASECRLRKTLIATTVR